MQINKKPAFEQYLLEEKIIKQEQYDFIISKSGEAGSSLDEILLSLGIFEDEDALLDTFAKYYGVERIRLRDIVVDSSVINRIPANFATYFKVMPIAFENDVLSLASSTPLDLRVMDGCALIESESIKMVFASKREVDEAIRKFYGVGAHTIDQMMGSVKDVEPEDVMVDSIDQIDSEASIGKFLNQILFEAYKDRATDIHIEPFEHELKIRYRIDGVLHDAQVPQNIWHFRDAINSRIKILAHLNIAERRLPQDGRFRVKVKHESLDLRVSFLPTDFGESVVVRILNSTQLMSLKDLGVETLDLSVLNTIIKKPHGIIFLTGPTGSGKTTTLYSCLSHINKLDNKIITIEDPVEYQLNGVIQMPINPAIGLSFAQGLRSMLRHDPDIMMVGEVRDKETADIAIQVALTGHLVFSTLHTNDAASGVTRLIDMGVEPYLISSSVECFIAQRLIRLICPHCKIEKSMTAESMDELMFHSVQMKDVVFYEGQGCHKCNFSGYHGRAGIFEFLLLSDEIKELIVQRASSSVIEKKAVEIGMKTLLESGWDKVRQGVTTVDEILRVNKEDTV